MTQKIFCCKCNKHIKARLTNGKEVYPYRSDLHKLPFWKCDQCKNFVGCHTAKIRTIEEAREIYRIGKRIQQELM